MSGQLDSNKVASRYAKALFEASVESGQLNKVIEDLSALQKLFKELPDLMRFLENPAIPVAEKTDLAQQKIHGSLTPLVGNLLLLMIQNRRIHAFGQVIENLLTLIRRRENIATAEVITATELDATLSSKIQKSLQEKFGFAKVELTHRVEPGILGGVIVKLQDQLIDGSFSGKLEKMRNALGKQLA